MYTGTGTEMVKSGALPAFYIEPLEVRAKKTPNTRLLTLEYFDAAGFWLPHTASSLSELPQSLVLRLLEHGADLHDVRDEQLSGREGETHQTLIELATNERSYRF